MYIFEYPNNLESYFKDGYNEKLARKIVNDNPDMYYLREEGIITQLIEKGKEIFYTKLDSFNPSYKEYHAKNKTI